MNDYSLVNREIDCEAYEQVTQQIRSWLTSPEGKRVTEHANMKARELQERYRRAKNISPDLFDLRMTI